MSNAIETACERVFKSALDSIAKTRGLQIVRQIEGVELAPERIVVTAKDLGEDRSVKINGTWARKVDVEIRMRGNAGDRPAKWFEDTAAEAEEALNPPICSPASLAVFVVLVIQEVAQSDLSFDKANWSKHFTLSLTAKLL